MNQLYRFILFILLGILFLPGSLSQTALAQTSDCIFLPMIANNSDQNSSQNSTQIRVRTSGVNASQQNPCAVTPTTPLPPSTLERTSPAANEGDVAVTRETVLTFEEPLDPTTVTSSSISASAIGTTLNTRLHLSLDQKQVTLFHDEPLPDGIAIDVRIDGDALTDAHGRKIDPDHDGTAGGLYTFTFQTLDLTPLAGTVVCGRVVASELAADDAGNALDRPLTGATITVDGAEATLHATTNEDGHFCLDQVPGNRFFVHIDGRTASADVPSGAYYPSVGKAWDPVPGQQTDVGTIYLPLVQPNTLNSISTSESTTIHFAQSVLEQFPEMGDVRLQVPANSLFADDGTRGGQVGIAPVPPERLPGQLPGNLNFPVVITVQTDGATNFDVPAPICFPNLPDPNTGERLVAGAGSSLVSFNHDIGRWEVVGSMTVSADATLICTDPGVGIRAPGWHGAQAGNGLFAGGAGLGSCNGCDAATEEASALGDDCLDNVNQLIQSQAPPVKPVA